MSADAAERVLDESTWSDGSPPERALVALFAAMTPGQLDELLREMIRRALTEIEGDVRPLASIREMVEGRRAQDVDERTWDFAGGEWLLEAVQALEASSRLWRNALKSLSHALAAAQAAVAAVVDVREWVRDATERARLSELLEKGPLNPSEVSPEWRAHAVRDRHDAWMRLLAGLNDRRRPA